MRRSIRFCFPFFVCLGLFNALGSYVYFQLSFSTSQIDPIQSTYQIGTVFFHDHGESHGISKTTVSRLKQAIRLHENNRLQHLVCVGGCQDEPGLRGSYKMKMYLEKNGIPGESVQADTCSYDTTRNIKNMIRFMDKHGLQSCVLISSPLHLYRIKTLAEKFGEPGMRFRCNSYWEHYLRDNSLWTIWKDIQYEFAAWLAMWILPEKLHQHILRMWRVESSELPFINC